MKKDYFKTVKFHLKLLKVDMNCELLNLPWIRKRIQTLTPKKSYDDFGSSVRGKVHQQNAAHIRPSRDWSFIPCVNIHIHSREHGRNWAACGDDAFCGFWLLRARAHQYIGIPVVDVDVFAVFQNKIARAHQY